MLHVPLFQTGVNYTLEESAQVEKNMWSLQTSYTV